MGVCFAESTPSRRIARWFSGRPQYMEYAAQTGIADHVTWTGLVEDPIAEGVYDAADVFCQLSRWREAFGFVIAEAMACRKPVIGASVGGVPEVVQDGTAGFLVPLRQPAVAAQRILQLLGDAPLRRRMGDAGRARVEELFDLRRTVADLIALYGISNHPALFSRFAGRRTFAGDHSGASIRQDFVGGDRPGVPRNVENPRNAPIRR